jgi:integrase
MSRGFGPFSGRLRGCPDCHDGIRRRARAAAESCCPGTARSGEILEMQWSEIDLDKKIWTVSANRMKAGREHRVPLSPRAVAILRQLEKIKTDDFVFAVKYATSCFRIWLWKWCCGA